MSTHRHGGVFDCGQIGHAQGRVRFGESGVKRMSAFGGRADIRSTVLKSPLIARSGHLASRPFRAPKLSLRKQKKPTPREAGSTRAIFEVPLKGALPN